MSWKISHEGNKYKVVKESTGKVVGTHSSHAKAVAQMRALYANTSEMEQHSTEMAKAMRKKT